MGNEDRHEVSRGAAIRRWVHRFFIVWAIGSTLWLVNSFRTQGVDATLLASDETVSVHDTVEWLAFVPNATSSPTGLVFITGGGVAAEAYAPLLRPIAEQGHAVFIVRLPWRLAPLPGHKQTAVLRARAIVDGSNAAERWVIAGHSLGGALTTQLAARRPANVVAMVLIGTTHPKELDLTDLPFPAIKVYGSADGVAPVEMIDANRDLLPADTRWVEIEGGNHAQFGHYGSQLFDGTATISRRRQQELTRDALLAALQRAASR